MALAMTRREAARVLAGALVGAALPGARLFASPQNYPCKEGRFECSCPNPYKGNYRQCCPSDEKCQCHPRAAVCIAAICPGGVLCGSHYCCLAGEVCADPKSGTCCAEGASSCTTTPEFSTDAVPRGRCCAPGEVCKSTRKASACCRPGQSLTADGGCT